MSLAAFSTLSSGESLGMKNISEEAFMRMSEAFSISLIVIVLINTAYGDIGQYKLIINNVREVAEIQIIIDVKGPEIRLKVREKRFVQKGEIIKVGFGHEEVSFNHDFYDEIDIGDEIYIDNGKIKTRVIERNR